MKRTHILCLVAPLAISVYAEAAVNVPLIVQEAIYPGSVAGVTRAADPVSVGVPLPDDAANGITDVNQLTLTGASVAQFRVLGRWPSGRIKWVLVDTQADVAAGQKHTSMALTGGGNGNFGGPNLAVDNGATITIDTGAARFTVRKAGFNVLDEVVIGSVTVVASGSSQGMVLTGPAPGQTTCPPCTTVYSSANDTGSTAVIEENGPAKAVIKATGRHVNVAGNAYMQFTVRIYFFKGKTSAKVTSILRNAEYGKSNTFQSAYKGHQGYELRVQPNITGPVTYKIGNHTASATTGTASGSDSVYLYQGEALSMKTDDWCGWGCVPYTTDRGYSIVKNGLTVLSGTNAQYPQGWADVSDASGVGVETGVYQLAAYWPKSLEFNNGGRDVRIGVWARQNSQPYYQVWPQWSIHDLYLNFHAAPLASPADEFLKFQHYLLGRAVYTHYNSTAVFPYTLVDPTTEDEWYKSTASSAKPAIQQSNACCIADYGVTSSRWPLNIFRIYSWGGPGGANQTEFRWSNLLNFITRGMAGRYLQAAHFYRFQSESFLPHSDGFDWRNQPHANQANPELNGFGQPNATSANSDKAFRNWRDQEHGHWYGMPDYYYMTGDQTTLEAMLDQTKDWYLNGDTYQAGAAGGLYNSRSVGIQLIGAARFAQFLSSIGDPDASGVLANAVNTYNIQVKPELCVSGYPAGCSIGGQIDGGPWNTQGVSRTRGVPWGASGGSGTWCGVSHAYRVNSSFQPAILIQGLLELRNVMGPAWHEYYNSLDLAYGIARWNLSENYVDDGSGRWDVNGFRFGIALDVPNSCTGPGEIAEPNFQPVPTQTTAMTFLAKYLVDGSIDWAVKFNTNTQRLMAALGTTTSDFGSYQPAHLIDILSRPASAVLNGVPLAGVTENGGASYTLTWTVPAGAQSYRIKWAAKEIVDWVGFDPANNRFLGDPARTTPWFAATNVSSLPSPGAPGSTQTLTINTGVPGLKAKNFSVKAYVGGGTSTSPPPPSGPTSLSLVSGNNQAGPAGAVLSSPLAVKVSDASGNAVSGVAVAFAVAAGGGSLGSAQTVTNAQGIASTTLTLGPAAGINTVTASAGGLTGSPVTFSATATAPGPSILTIVTGNNQTGTTGQSLSGAFTVKVSDAAGTGVAGVSVTFAVAAGGGSLSASTVSTNSSGMAAATLTLGPNPGQNIVSAAAGALSGSPVTFTATATAPAPPSGAPSVTWSAYDTGSTGPGYNGWHSLWYDPLSQQTILYGVVRSSTSIYSTDIFFYKAATNAWTHLGGTGSRLGLCPADTPTWPGDRHPGWMMSVDTKRNFLWIFGGVNQACNGGYVNTAGTAVTRVQTGYQFPTDGSWSGMAFQIGSATYTVDHVVDANNLVLTSSAGVQSNAIYSLPTNRSPREDMYYLKLNADATRATWHRVYPPRLPSANVVAAMAYDPDDDVLFVYGNGGGGQENNNWVYCPTIDNPSPGTLTAKQSAAGCAAADNWTRIAVAGGVQPRAVSFPGMVYDTATKKIILFGGMSSGLSTSYNETWAYNIPTKTWTQKALSTTPPPVYSGSWVPQPAMAYIPGTQKILYHQVSNSGAPADWQYDPVADTWTKLTSAGSGAATDQVLTYDPSVNRLIGFNRASSGYPVVWQGALNGNGSPAPGSPCDLNGDGAVNSADLQVSIQQVLGAVTCGSADLDANGACDVVDVQRVITAILGGSCRIGM